LRKRAEKDGKLAQTASSRGESNLRGAEKAGRSLRRRRSQGAKKTVKSRGKGENTEKKIENGRGVYLNESADVGKAWASWKEREISTTMDVPLEKLPGKRKSSEGRKTKRENCRCERKM